ncbi:MAG: DUF4270 domain-containing protein [Chitinophagaceae bacterium]|nr:DUF4270 domain-containing protein [Chitinophagaceae bacterium]
MSVCRQQNNCQKSIVRQLLACISISMLLVSCYKTNVVFEDNDVLNDPNLSFFDTYKVDIATYKTDSFITSGGRVLMLGTHNDTLFSKLTAETYAEIAIPVNNPVSDINANNILFDSIVLVLAPTGNYYGDTMMPLSLSVHELTEPLENEEEEDNTYYYPRSFASKTAAMGQTIITNLRPGRKKEITIRLPDTLGQDLLNKLRRNADEISTQDEFRDYFKGICIKGDSNFNKTIYYFGAGAGDKLFRIYYRERDVFLTEKTVEFGYVTVKQFNHIIQNNKVTPFSGFRPFKKEVIASAKMNGRAYLSNNIPSYMKITFPQLLSLKEIAPFVRVIKAELEVKPSPGTYRYPYKLPPQLNLVTSNADNSFDNFILGLNGNIQNGNLVVDNLYGKDTRYTFDITSFINTVINEGRYSTKALFLGINATGFSTESQRLIINEQSSTDGIKLKLYVLGL